MSYPGDQSAQNTPRPSPGAMPRRQYDPMSAFDESAEVELDAPDVEATVSELLARVDEIREAAGETFSLAVLERQAALLEQAHDVLTAALDAVDRR
ncbi:hypothetical protein [Gordonia aurantiaca]|uniref:hypothetical protein n=1 Tax=Gordonia sp. B21 TaxID=3151852 RepID=UPI00326474D9